MRLADREKIQDPYFQIRQLPHFYLFPHVFLSLMKTTQTIPATAHSALFPPRPPPPPPLPLPLPLPPAPSTRACAVLRSPTTVPSTPTPDVRKMSNRHANVHLRASCATVPLFL